MLWIILAILIAAADQFSKYLVMKNIQPNQMIPVIDHFFYLTFIKNKGAAFSTLLNGRVFFLILTPVVAVFLVYFIIKSRSRLLSLSLSMILGGAVGNYVDRLFAGSVTDFFSFRFGSYPFAIFNVGDAVITVGTVILAAYLLFVYKEPDRKGAKGGNVGREDPGQENAMQEDVEQGNAGREGAGQGNAMQEDIEQGNAGQGGAGQGDAMQEDAGQEGSGRKDAEYEDAQ